MPRSRVYFGNIPAVAATPTRAYAVIIVCMALIGGLLVAVLA